MAIVKIAQNQHIFCCVCVTNWDKLGQQHRMNCLEQLRTAKLLLSMLMKSMRVCTFPLNALFASDFWSLSLALSYSLFLSERFGTFRNHLTIYCRILFIPS